MVYLVTCFFLILMVMISVGFFTLLERKVMGYCHNRKGPNKVGYFGLFQPFSDGLKLFVSEQLFPVNSNFVIYYICPLFSLIYSLFVWCLFPFYVNCLNFSYGLLFFLCCSSISIYGLIVCGWSSNSIYSLLGCMRSVSQAISYEVSLSIILLCYFFLCESYNFIDFYLIQNLCWFFYFSIPMFFCWISCCLAESNRTPFDFSEGESELVSGFNVEYGGSGFALLFISEYSSIIFIGVLTVIIYMGGNFHSFIFFISVVFMCFFFIWIRCTLPRYRYDKLMYLAWKCYLPMSLNYIFMFVFFKSLVFYHFYLLS
nr:NADH dehydrogenase subunit 1 [Elbelus tripunctatus]